MAKKTKTQTLAALVEAEAKERGRARDLDAAAQVATADADRARVKLVEAHAADMPRAVKAAESAHQDAVKQAEAASIQAEAARLRVDRAGEERNGYEAGNARALIEELQAQATNVVERLQSSAAGLVEADREWGTISQRVNELLVRIPGAPAASNAPDAHALHDIAREVRKALASTHVASPLPHWSGLEQQQAEQRTRAQVSRENTHDDDSTRRRTDTARTAA